MSLLSKLTESIKNVGYKLSDGAQALLNKIHITGNNKVVKAIASLALASTMALSVGTLSACSSCNTTTTPGTSTEQGNNQGSNNNQGNNNKEDDAELSKYSQILQTVLTDEYYDEVYAARVDSSNGRQRQYGIPFKFLSSQGYNEEEVKSDKVWCLSTAYVVEDKTNDLYLTLKVENKYSKGTYYSNYILKYSLSNKEYEDLYMLFKGRYMQAFYFIQELDRQRTPVVEANYKIDTQTYRDFLSVLKTYSKQQINIDNISYDISSLSQQNKHLGLNLFATQKSSTTLISTSELHTLDVYISDASAPRYIDGVLSIEYPSQLNPQNTEQFKTNGISVICFDADNITNTSNYLKDNDL